MAKKLTYYIWPLGCAMNYADAERVAMVLDGLGMKQTGEEKKANVIVAMACSVRQSAIDRILGKAVLWKNFKKRQLKLTLLSGCVLPADKTKLAKIFDLTFNILELGKLPTILAKKLKLKTVVKNADGFWQILPKRQNNWQALIPISFGCNKFCAYCAVPYTRGLEKNRPAKEILNEIKQAVKNKVKEIILLGQTVNSYTNPETGSKIKDFNDLLATTAQLAPRAWIRFSSPYPTEFNDRLIQTVAKYPNICNYFHLPVQSGSDKILKSMNRRYTKAEYLKIIKTIRQIIPACAITTDTIVGFCGETNEDFKQTLDLFKKARFDMAYLAQYSPRAGTVSARTMQDNVPKTTKVKRERILNALLTKTAAANNKKYAKQIVEVLIENQRKNFLLGKTATFKTVKIKTSDSYPIGSLVKVKITKTAAFGLEGEII
ncbi:MAG: tRNA (N6-isopentenyl adenosine(37)-C2)-methylthiotransferase MiaB [Candidatus Komeilibacteria bacterium]|nr:tRNA (N6-isopentenyl adenosine(37)-C2)-methylthiotransferase MiaB [Candidatus Komeilibacteria bacterium]